MQVCLGRLGRGVGRRLKRVVDERDALASRLRSNLSAPTRLPLVTNGK
jgi:hypothetical protein